MNDLLVWSDTFDKHPFFMSWSCLTGDQTIVDFFDYRLEEGPRDDPRHQHLVVVPEEGALEHYAGSLDALADESDEDELLVGQGRSSSGRHERPAQTRSARPSADPQPPGGLARHMRTRLSDDEQLLYDTAPPLTNGRDRLLERQVRGAWAPLDLFGPTGYHFFLGVLDRGFTEAEAAEWSRPRDLDVSIEAGVTGRLVSAVTRIGSTVPPPFSDLVDAIAPYS
ncbi:hypothetical protein J4573_08820 [Actinomadura barringtoniae]|uniref:Uncharacterized protein n=1 Tax=Actinomadura barringtoniae TaxID=1427535 RepID=A0A939PDD1_9ACTN|nr:hypothetical protein [Actinomadura barringtoniae]MBO2447184.1 hypothetical protein [Actinomadura barringtoniae]